MGNVKINMFAPEVDQTHDLNEDFRGKIKKVASTTAPELKHVTHANNLVFRNKSSWYLPGALASQLYL